MIQLDFSEKASICGKPVNLCQNCRKTIFIFTLFVSANNQTVDPPLHDHFLCVLKLIFVSVCFRNLLSSRTISFLLWVMGSYTNTYSNWWRFLDFFFFYLFCLWALLAGLKWAGQCSKNILPFSHQDFNQNLTTVQLFGHCHSNLIKPAPTQSWLAFLCMYLFSTEYLMFSEIVQVGFHFTATQSSTWLTSLFYNDAILID